MNVMREVFLKMVALICTAFVILAVVLAHRSPAAGYELSIYASTPFAVMWLLLLSLAGGIAIVLHELSTSRYREGRTYLLGFAVILLSATAFLCLPAIRNYVASTGADHFGHVGFVLDILRTGHLGDRLVYPVIHSLLAQIASVTGLSALQVVNLNTVLVLPVFTLMAYLLATAVLPNKGQRLLAALVAGGTMAGISRYYLVPNTWSILMLPLLFYCYFNKDRIPFKVLLVALLVVYPFFHPLSSLVVMVALVTMELPKPVYARLFKWLGMGVPPWMESRPVVWPILLEAAVFLPWVTTRESFQSNIRGFWDGLVNFAGAQGVQEAGQDLAKANVQGLDILTLLVRMHGELLIFLVLAILAGIVLIKQLRLGIRDSAKYRLLLFGVWIPLIVILFLADFVGLPAARMLAADRMLGYVEICCIPFVALALWGIARGIRPSRLAKVVTYGLIILALLLNFFGHYTSPYLVRPNQQVTHRDMTGMVWYMEKKDPAVPAYCVMVLPERFSQATVGIKVTRLRLDWGADWQVETHFGYDNYTTVREQYGMDIFININRLDKVAYQTVWRSLGRFNNADYEMLELDPTVDRIYSNGGMDVLFVSQKSGP